MSTNEFIPALEVGGTHVSAALVDAQTWASTSPLRAELDSHGSESDILRGIARCATSLGAPAGAVWGAAFPGPLDYRGGVGRFVDVGKFDALNGIDLRRALVEGIEPRPADVLFIKDSDAFAIGEWRSGTAAGHRRFVAITLGTGVGSAFVADGAIVDDSPEVPAEGRVDLLAVGGLPLEETVSRRAILVTYSNRRHEPSSALDVRELCELARNGDHDARMSISNAMAGLGFVLAPWLHRFRATLLVVGGSIARSWDIVRTPLWSGLVETTPALEKSLTMVQARHPESSAIVGAAIMTRHRARR